MVMRIGFYYMKRLKKGYMGGVLASYIMVGG